MSSSATMFFISPFIVPPVLLQTINTLIFFYILFIVPPVLLQTINTLIFFYIPFIVPPVKLQTISTCNISYIDCGPVEEYSIEYPPFSGSRAYENLVVSSAGLKRFNLL